jgi:glycosyltransferase involved in cell wall biosynthesis
VALSNSNRIIRRVAILNPLNDYGIAGYTHEFAEGLAANGYLVSVYSDSNVSLQELPAPRRYEMLPVLGKALLKQAALPRLISSAQKVQSTSMFPAFGLDTHMLQLAPAFQANGTPVQFAMNLGRARTGDPRSASVRQRLAAPARLIKRQMRDWVRIRYLSSELACHLRMRNYDLVWTQWYSADVFDSAFWRACKLLKLPVLHTVHNVLPHEREESDWDTFNEVYGHSKLLAVHSHYSQSELQNEFPHHAAKSIVMPHGIYSSLHKRVPECREQTRRALGIDLNSPVLLFCGAIRPYKNIDAVIASLDQPDFSDATLVISGKESGYPDSNQTDPLQRTKALLAKHRPTCRVKLIPKTLDTAEMSELFEASDILLLPYLKGYGSGLLLLGMTFGKHIVATSAGGSEEYLQHYENHTLLAGPSSREVAHGIRQAIERVRRSPSPVEPPPGLSWRHITARVMESAEQLLADKN